MAKIPEERRIYPRIKSNMKVVELSNNICAESIDLSENGLSFACRETISGPAVCLEVRFPGNDITFETNARLVWTRDLDDGNSLYGLEFVDLNETLKGVLRKELIEMQISQLLNEIEDPEVKNDVGNFFLNGVLSYVSQIVKLIPCLSRDEYSIELEKKIEQLNNQLLLKGYCLEELLSDREIIQKAKDNFRKLIGTWVYKSAIVKRAFEKPKGYSGDYRVLEFIYNNTPISKKIGLYFDNYFLKSPYSVTVRMRKDRMRELLQKFINETQFNPIRILDIAGCPCREIKELLAGSRIQNPLIFSCLDCDEEALRFSQDTLLQVAPKNVTFRFVKQDITNIIENKISAELLGKQNFIYSLGIIDYLPDALSKKLISALYALLEKGGKLILTHKNREKTFPAIPPDWFCDWRFVPRDKEEAIGLFYNSGISDFTLSLECDNFGYVYYFTITKKST